MPNVASHILGILLTGFLILGGLNLNLRRLIALVTSVKRLKAIWAGRFSLETGKIEARPEPRQIFMIPAGFCYPSLMSSNLDQLTEDAMKLPLRDRVQLAHRLVSTLDDRVETGAEELWFSEAERRLEELRSGEVEGVDSDEAFRTAREALKR